MSIGVWQIVVILLIVLIVFGAGKLPRVMGDMAKGIKSFKSGLREDDADERPEDRAIDAKRSASESRKVETDEVVKS